MFNENDLTVENMKFFSREAALKEGVRVSELKNSVITNAFNSVKERLSNKFGTSITLDSKSTNLTEFEPNSLSGRIIATLSVDTIDGIKRVPVTFKVRASVSTLAESMDEIQEKLDETEGSLASEVKEIMAAQEEKLKAKEEEDKVAKEIEADILEGISLEASKENRIFKAAAKEEIDMHTLQDNSLGSALPLQILTYPKAYLPEMKKNKSIINVGGFKYKYIGDEPTMTGDTEDGIIARFALIPVSKKASLLTVKENDLDTEAAKEEPLSDVKTTDSTPEGLFTKSGAEIASKLLSESGGDAGKAMQKLVFYMNRAGKDLAHKGNLEDAKKILHDKVEKEEKKASLNVTAEDYDYGSMTADELEKLLRADIDVNKPHDKDLLATVEMLPEVSSWYLTYHSSLEEALSKSTPGMLKALERSPRYAFQVFEEFTKGNDFDSFPEEIKTGILSNMDILEKFAKKFPKAITTEVAEAIADNSNVAYSLLEDVGANLSKEVKDILVESAKEAGYTENSDKEEDTRTDEEKAADEDMKETEKVTEDFSETEASKESDIEVDAKVVQKGDKWEAQSESGKGFGTYNTKEEAEERVKQMEKFKHIKKSKADIASPVQPSQATDEEVK